MPHPRFVNSDVLELGLKEAQRRRMHGGDVCYFGQARESVAGSERVAIVGGTFGAA